MKKFQFYVFIYLIKSNMKLFSEFYSCSILSTRFSKYVPKPHTLKVQWKTTVQHICVLYVIQSGAIISAPHLSNTLCKHSLQRFWFYYLHVDSIIGCLLFSTFFFESKNSVFCKNNTKA